MNDEKNSPVAEISAAFGADSRVAGVERSQVLQWMSSDDLEVLGAVCHLIVDRPSANDKILPPLEREHYDVFLRTYLARCIRENPDGDWAHGRYLAGYEVVSWIVGLWKRGELDDITATRWKSWLADLYLSGDEGVRDGVVNGALEHLFEEKAVRKLFADWRNHPELAKPYKEASAWVGLDDGSSTPSSGL